MKKVLFTATVDSHIKQFHLPYLQWFKEQGYEVHVATNGEEEIPYCNMKHKISFERNPIKLNNLKAIKQLRKVINDEKFEIIHCHTPMGSVVTRIAAMKARKKYNTKVIYTAHGFHFYKGAPIKNWLLFYPVEKYLAKYTDTIILINLEDYNLAKCKFLKRCKNIKYIPGVGINNKRFDFEMQETEKTELRKSLGIKKDDFVIVYSAEISKRKRQEWLINAISELLKNNKNIHLLFPGKDSLNGKCNKIAKKMEIKEQIHFLGYRSDMPKLLKISDMAVSSAKQEGLPMNIMEAMYEGLPIVVSDCRGNRDLVRDHINGFLVNLNDKQRFSDRIKEIYLNKNLYEKYGIESKKSIQKYLIQDILPKMEEIYNTYKREEKKVAIITSGFLPVPASKGGAAENLIDTFVEQNEIYGKIQPVIFSVYDKEAYEKSKKNKKTEYVFIKPNNIALIIDKFNYFIIDKILKKENSRKFRYVLQRFDFLYKCSKYLANNNYDKVILENHTIMYFSLKWHKNYKKYKGKYYYHCHNVVPSLYGLEDIISSTCKVISVSRFRNQYVKENFNMKEERCKVVKNCCGNDIYIKASDIELRELKQLYNIKNEKVIIYVGRVDKDKGTLELIKACNKVKNTNFKLIIVGAPIFATGITTEYENIIREEVNKNKERFIMTGYVNHNELYKYYGIADVVAIPSQVDDSAPLVLIESMICGKPVIATNCGGIPEYVNEKCAVLIDRNEKYIENFAQAIDKLISKDKILEDMSKESLKLSKKYNSKNYYNEFVNEIIN